MMSSFLRCLLGCCLLAGIGVGLALYWRSAAAPSTTHQALPIAPPQANYGQVPLSFEANHGQAKEPVQYLARGTNATLYLTPTEAALEVRSGQPTTDHQPPATAVVKMKLLGAKTAPRMQGEAELPGKSNYFRGHDPQAWQTNIPTYRQVKYAEVYAGVDLIYYGNQQQLEYDFVVQPGADPQAIRFRLEGADAIALNEQGALVLQTAAGEIKQHKPVVYQEVNGEKKEIAGEYVLKDGEVGFAVGAYDVSQPLVIDPVIVYATYLGTGSLGGFAITTDATGQVYLAMNYGPAATSGAYQNGTGFSIIKLNKSGTAALYTATMGGGQSDRVFGITVDAQGNCYLTGQATSSTFPTTPNAFQTDAGLTCGACYNAFVAKVNSTGNDLLYSTFLKGDQATQGVNGKLTRAQAIAIDSAGNAYVTGHTNVKDFPTTPNAFQTHLNIDREPAQDAFITKVNPTGTGLIYSTYFGAGDNLDQGKNIAVDVAGNAYVVGGTGNGYSGSTDRNPKTPFPKTPGAYQTPDTNGTGGGIFLSKFNPSGSALLYSTIIGTGSFSNLNIPLAIDVSGNAYISTSTQSPVFPVTPGAFQTTFNSGYQEFQAFITKVNPTGTSLVFSTFLGGSASEAALAMGVDIEGNVTVVGVATSPDFPQTGEPESFFVGNGFVTKLNAAGSQLLYSKLLSWTMPWNAAFDDSGNVYIQGDERGTFQVTPGAYQSVRGSTTLTKISLPKSAVTVSAANYSGSPLASEAIVSTFGTGLATTTQNANALPLPTTLGGTTVKVRDSGGTERDASLFFASPTQVNFQLPAGTANGPATITITAQDGATFVSLVEIANVVPSLFSADTTGRGIAAAQVQRAGSAAFEPMVTFDVTKGQFVAVPIDLGGVNEQVYLVLYGTGIRLRSSLNNVTATMGGVAAPVTYAGAQGGFVGLDQVNLLIPRSLIGRGLVDAVLTVDGKVANTVKASIK